MSLQATPDQPTAMAVRTLQFARNFGVIFQRSQQLLPRKSNIRLLSDKVIDWTGAEPPIPEYKAPQNETIARKRARLLYQSR